MKSIIFTAALLLSLNIFGQIELNYKDVFLRVYNKKGKKIAKGKLVLITDSSMVLLKRRKWIEIQLEDINRIRTKRSFGNNILKGAAIGGGTLAFIGAASAPNDNAFLSYTPLEGATIGTFIGGFYGAGIGAFTGIFKNSNVFMIDSEVTKLEFFKNVILEK